MRYAGNDSIMKINTIGFSLAHVGSMMHSLAQTLKRKLKFGNQEAALVMYVI
jgi:hypothetical protein